MRIPVNPNNSVIYKARQIPYFWACATAGLAVYPLAIAFVAPVLALMIAMDELMISAVVQVSPYIARAAFVAVTAICTGSAIGLLQKHIVRSHFNIDLGRWRLVSVLGAGVACGVIWYSLENEDYLLRLMRNPLGDRLCLSYDSLSSLINYPMIQFAFVLSAMQMVYLIRFVRSVWLWLAANVAAGALFLWLFVYAFVGESLMSWLIAAIAQALLVGIAMSYLMTRRRRGGKAKRKDSSCT